MAIVIPGIDLAKEVFVLHGVADAGHVESRKPPASGDVVLAGDR